MTGYTAEQLKKNRAPVLLFGGSEADRKAFALLAAQAFPQEGPLLEARDEASLARALSRPRGVVYVPEVSALPAAAQREVVRVLREQEERPKLVCGLSMLPASALEKGLIRDDLHYWFRAGQVDLKARPPRR